MAQRALIAVLVLGVAALAFAQRPNPSEAAPSNPGAAAADTTVLAEVKLDVAEDVNFELVVSNNTARRVEVRFPNGQTHDFAIVDSTGNEVWRWSEGKLFTQVLQNRLVNSRATLSFRQRWKPEGLSGTFTLIATLHSTNFPLEQRVDFTIP